MTQSAESANRQISNLVDAHLQKTRKGSRYDNVLDDSARSESELSIKRFDDEVQKLSKSVSDQFKDGTVISESKDLMADLNALKSKLEKLADLRLGVFRVETPKEEGVAFVGADEKSKSPVVIRDARLQGELKAQRKNHIVDNPNKVREAWMVNATANTMGFIKLIELSEGEHKERLKKVILERFHECISKISTSDSPKKRSQQVQDMNNEMKALLQVSGVKIEGQDLNKLSNKEFSKMLLSARDFTNFEREHSSTVTISDNLSNTGSVVNHVESFVPVVPMSDSLKANYNNLENQSWYKALDPVNKKLVESYKDKVTDGKHIIPTQLQFLPGVRNYGLSSTFFGNDGVVQTRSQYSFMRSGTPAYNNAKSVVNDKDAMQNLTSQNVEHIAQIASLSNKTVNFNTVTNEIGNERRMGQAVRKAVADRSAVKLDVSGSHAGESDTDSFIEEETNAKSTTTKSSLSITLSNKHRNLTNSWNAIKDTVSGMVHIGCKSGKDRTGLFDKHAKLKAVKEYMHDLYSTESSSDAEHTKPDYKRAYEVYNAGQHNEILAGGDGGSHGCYGLKASTSYNLAINKLSPKNILHSIKRFTLGNKDVANMNIPHLGLAEVKASFKTEDQNIGLEINPTMRSQQRHSEHFNSSEMRDDIGLLGGEKKKPQGLGSRVAHAVKKGFSRG